MKFSKTASDGGSVIETRRKQTFILRGSPIGFFTPVIPTQNFMQSCNPEGYFFGIPPPAHTFNPKSRSEVPNPELRMWENTYPEKPIENPLPSMTAP